MSVITPVTRTVRSSQLKSVPTTTTASSRQTVNSSIIQSAISPPQHGISCSCSLCAGNLTKTKPSNTTKNPIEPKPQQKTGHGSTCTGKLCASGLNETDPTDTTENPIEPKPQQITEHGSKCRCKLCASGLNDRNLLH